MRAIEVRDFGPPDVLQLAGLADPVPGPDQVLIAVSADGGRFSAHGSPSGSFASIDADTARQRQVRVSTIGDLQFGRGDRSRLMKDAIDQLAGRRMVPLIGQTFALAEAEKAHQAIEARQTVAKTLLLSR
jgi:NADPH2:quinone reductase